MVDLLDGELKIFLLSCLLFLMGIINKGLRKLSVYPWGGRGGRGGTMRR